MRLLRAMPLTFVIGLLLLAVLAGLFILALKVLT